MLYEEGLRRAQSFAKDHEGLLSYKMEFSDHSGVEENTQPGVKKDETGGYGIYVQDLTRLKA